MAKPSKAELAFREKYPNTRVESVPSHIPGLTRYRVFAGDYLCAESVSRAFAFSTALHDAEDGIITPDPHEVSVGNAIA